MRALVATLLLLALAPNAAPLAGESAAGKLKSAGPNSWVLLADEAEGGRRWPMFVYHPGLGKYLLSAGGGTSYDQQILDPKTCTWSDFYPEGKAGLAPEAKMGQTGPGAVVDGVFRIRRVGNAFKPTDEQTYYQWALSPEDGCLYAYFQNATMRFDAKTGLWDVLDVPAFSDVFEQRTNESRLTVGSLAWDPVNKEIVSCGGSCDTRGGSPGTWTFKPGAGKWQRAPSGSEELRKLRARARELEPRTGALVNAWRNRFYLTETEEEAKADIGAGAAALVKDLETLIAGVREARLTGFEKGIPGPASAFFSKVLAELKTAVATSDPRGRLLALQQVRDHLEIAARSLDSEPCGRGLSQMATDPKRGMIVLFGGCRLDSYLADTWVYHCRERRWEQRWPEVSPAPRAGHLLGYLPRSGAVVLFGATNYDTHATPPYQTQSVPRDLWIYDVDANRWKLLAQSGKPPTNGTGAVGPGDELIFLPRPTKPQAVGARQTWGLQVDASAPDAGSAKAGVVPGTVTYIFHGPEHFDREAKIEPEKIDAFLKNLPPNRWTPMPRQSPDCNGHEWCASAYDAGRHQILFYGGGHSHWHYNDVSHYSLRTATWSTGYRDEFPFGPSGFKSPVNQSFNNRPFFGSHIWDAIAYDPAADRAVMCTRSNAWAYDPAIREWTGRSSSSSAQSLQVSMAETPHGAVLWFRDSLSLFDGEAGAWRPLPQTGAKLVSAYGDRSGVCYDSKRDCLWLAYLGSPMFRYDFEGGKLTSLPCPKPDKVFMRETVYVPELDMVVSVTRNQSADGGTGNLAYDISAGKWVLASLDFADSKPHLSQSHLTHVSDGLHYDPLYKVVLLNRNNREVLVARPEKNGLKVLEAPVAAPDGK